MKPTPYGRPTWIEIDRAAIAHNVRLLLGRLHPDCRLMAVVKANGYGHGAVTVAQLAIAAGADRCGVASLAEAVELRQQGIHAPILVLGYTAPWRAPEALHHNITLTVVDLESAQEIARMVAQAGGKLTVHVKVNTGMNRLGVSPEEAPAFIAALHALPALRVEGIFSHFATSDEMDKSYAQLQFARFEQLLATLAASGLRPPIAHAANSAALLTMPETHLDMARSGIAIYGLDPDADQCPLPKGFRPVLNWKAEVVQVRRLAVGDPVSYGREFIAERPMTVAVVPVGYADGFPRRPYTWGHVLIGGLPASILGRVCMDQCIVDVSAQAAEGGVRLGDEVVLIGRQEGAHIRAEDAANRVGTNNYDIVSRILPRVPRVLSSS
jgi:alanine racemase